MIKKITIIDEAIFENAVMEPTKINYIFGGNGTGKTTLSRFLMNPNAYPKSSICFANNNDSEILVYNKNFVEDNFNDKKAIKGIFTIGKESQEIETQIESKIKNKQDLDKKNSDLENSINNLNENAKSNKLNFEEACWSIKKSHDFLNNAS